MFEDYINRLRPYQYRDDLSGGENQRMEFFHNHQSPFDILLLPFVLIYLTFIYYKHKKGE